MSKHAQHSPTPRRPPVAMNESSKTWKEAMEAEKTKLVNKYEADIKELNEM